MSCLPWRPCLRHTILTYGLLASVEHLNKRCVQCCGAGIHPHTSRLPPLPYGDILCCSCTGELAIPPNPNESSRHCVIRYSNVDARTHFPLIVSSRKVMDDFTACILSGAFDCALHSPFRLGSNMFSHSQLLTLALGSYKNSARQPCCCCTAQLLYLDQHHDLTSLTNPLNHNR